SLKKSYPFLEGRFARRLVRLYGTRAKTLLGLARSYADLGQRFGGDLYEAEVRYLVENEWAVTAEDVLWRRTKCGLHIGAEEVEALGAFMRGIDKGQIRSEEHTSELQSRENIVCRLLLEKKNNEQRGLTINE